MKTIYHIIFVLLFAYTSQSCYTGCTGDPDLEMQCTQQVIIDNEQFLAAESNDYNIVNAVITEDCLTLSLRASGCDGESWVVELYDSDEILTASDGDTTPRRMLRLVLQNPELCEALITKDYSFDISNIQYGDQVLLVLANWETEILYDFD